MSVHPLLGYFSSFYVSIHPKLRDQYAAIRLLAMSMIVLAASAGGLWFGNPAKVFGDAMASLMQSAAGQAAVIQPSADNIATTAPAETRSPPEDAETVELPANFRASPNEALFREFVAWAAKQETRPVIAYPGSMDLMTDPAPPGQRGRKTLVIPVAPVPTPKSRMRSQLPQNAERQPTVTADPRSRLRSAQVVSQPTLLPALRWRLPTE